MIDRAWEQWIFWNLAHLSVLNIVAHKHFLAWRAFFLEGEEEGMNGFSAISSQVLQKASLDLRNTCRRCSYLNTYIYIYIGKEKKTVVYYLAAGIMLFKHSLFLWHSFLMGHSIIRLLKIVQIFSENFPSGALCLLSFFLNTVNKLFLAFLIGTSLTLIVS